MLMPVFAYYFRFPRMSPLLFQREGRARGEGDQLRHAPQGPLSACRGQRNLTPDDTACMYLLRRVSTSLARFGVAK